MKNRSVIIHSLEHARVAVTVAAELGCSVILRSAPGAAAYLGPQVFRDMVEETATELDIQAIEAVFDCGDDPGLALAALRHGLKAVCIDAPPETIKKITDIAAQTGARVETRAETPGNALSESLDLLDANDPEAAIRAWLTGN
ncbi:MAG: hypothetical protein ISR51_04515 [Rhodospirillales bacterium]|nr:hypothetical protein [Alphaproteobacteria bacterium]MBL6947918.1 hypothetical protein [Rhodospirillales bacterium]